MRKLKKKLDEKLVKELRYLVTAFIIIYILFIVSAVLILKEVIG